jgi:hypothetical protein
MNARTDKLLLAPGNEAEWAQVNAEKARQEAEFAASLSMNERVTLDQQLPAGGLPPRSLGRGRACPETSSLVLVSAAPDPLRRRNIRTMTRSSGDL